jgi:hypothetical protein
MQDGEQRFQCHAFMSLPVSSTVTRAEKKKDFEKFGLERKKNEKANGFFIFRAHLLSSKFQVL